MIASLKEHDFIQVRNRIYRIFGYEHPNGKYFSLLRYWRQDANSHWIKPPVNAAEKGEQDVLKLYDSELVTCEPYGIKLVLFKTGEIEKVFSSTAVNLVKNSIAIKIFSTIQKYFRKYYVTNNSEIQIGIVGSSLVGTYNSSSDIDIVFYGIKSDYEAINFVKPLLKNICDHSDHFYTGVPGKSVSDTRAFIQKSGIINLSKTNRAIFGTYILSRKLDIYYVRNIDFLTIRSPIETRVISKPSLFVGRVIRSENRIYYPPILTLKIEKKETEVIFLNHEAKFLINGDVVRFIAVEKLVENNVSDKWIEGDSVLLSTDLISCHPASNYSTDI